MTNQNEKGKEEQTFSLVTEEDNYEKTKPYFGIRRPGLYPSEASVEYTADGRKIIEGKCMRAAWYRALGVPKRDEVNVSLGMKAHLGKWDEIGAVDRWKQMGIWVDNNIKFFNKELALSGELDAILKNPSTGNLFGLEMKTFYGYYAGKTICGVEGKRTPLVPGRPKVEHFLQSSLYSWQYRNRLDEYRLYYLERGDGHRVEFRIGTIDNKDGTHQCYWEQIPGKYWGGFKEGKVIQPYTIEDIHARYKKLLGLLKEKKLPPKEFTDNWDDDTVEYKFKQGEVSKTNYEKWQKNPSKVTLGDWHCSYCDYKEQCREDELSASTEKESPTEE